MTDEAEIIEFLERLDFDVSDLENQVEFGSKLNDIFLAEFQTTATQKQIDVLFPLAEKKFLGFPEAGIKRVEFTRFGRKQTRFTLPKRRGLFSFKNALTAFGRLG